ncbi:ferrous iron transport protein A [uncultured Veillonella sp.]|uniref:FeoA family protein n=1 Tax=uncultured Veillonella sp. TaxID=159268 RepID=UPI0026264D71|nr:ferrous iron transport protein A [uncultured Veillonella sp.]
MIKQLAQLKPGEAGVITNLRGTGNIKHRLIDMGLVPGTAVRVMKFAPLGDPVEIKVKNFDLALRVSEAATIDVDTSQEA